MNYQYLQFWATAIIYFGTFNIGAVPIDETPTSNLIGGREIPNFQLRHLVDQPVRSPLIGNWIELDRASFVKVLNQTDRKALPLPEAHFITKRIQNWVDRLDQQLRNTYPQQLLNIPKPQIIIARAKRANAFGSVIPVCFDLPAKLSNAAQQIEELFINMRQNGRLSKRTSKDPCVIGNIDHLKAILPQIGTLDPLCKITIADDLISFSHCKFHDTLKGIGSAKKIVTLQTANWIVVNTGLIANMATERGVIGILGHELAHYYRAHGTSPSQQYGFFYQMGDANLALKPVADPALQAIGKSLLEASDQIQSLAMFHAVNQQTLSSALYLVTGNIILSHCKKDTNCSDPCKKVSEFPSSSEFNNRLQFFPFQAAKDSDLYGAFETLAEACLRDLPFNSAGITLATLRFSIINPKWVPFIQKAPPGLKTFMHQAFAKLNRLTTTYKPRAGSTWQVLLDLNSRLDEIERTALKTLLEAYDAKIGRYTEEQEADELSLEMINQIGFNPDAGVAAYLELGDAGGHQADKPNGTSIGTTNCRKYYQNNWQDDAGNPIFVPIGNYLYNHHNACFRAFNVDREIQAHHYSTYEVEPVSPVVPGISWQKIKTIAGRFFH